MISSTDEYSNWIDDLDPAVLRSFVAVSETGGFTRAAQRLHLTQSAVSHQIRKLEEQVGCLLLVRTTRSLDLTDDGRDLLRHARQILELLAQVERRFRPSPLAGVVRFGVPENFMGARLPLLLSRFARDFPQVRLEASVGTYLDLRAMIEDGRLDLAVTLAVVDDAAGACGIETVLRATRFVWAASESLSIRRDQPLPMMFAPPPCVHRRVGLAALEGTDIDWRLSFASASQEGLKAAIVAGLGITVQTQDELEPGMRRVDGVFGLPSLPKATFVLLRRLGDQAQAARALERMILALPDRGPPDPPAAAAGNPKAGPTEA